MTALAPWLLRCPLVAILRGIRPDEVAAIGDVLVAAGFAILEVPLNSPEPMLSIAVLGERFGDRVLVGAGTVTSPAEVGDVAAAGGRVIVMPHADAAVIKAAKALGLLALPGVATPTEAFGAIAAGADGLKLFPAEAAPPEVLKAMKAVLPKDLPVLPVGSITPARLAPYWAAGAAGFGLGSALYRPGATPDAVAQSAAAFMAAVATLPPR